MIRSEIKNFTMSFAKCGSFSCSTPATLFSVLKERGLFNYPNSDADAEVWRGYFDSPCEFATSFDMTDLDIKRKYIYLRFYGLDGIADVYLNDEKIATANNSHKTWTFDIKGLCRAGKNALRLVFSNGIGYGKPLCQLESEYGFPIVDAGISGKVELLKFNNAIIDNIMLTEATEGESATVHIYLETLGNPDSVKAVATLISGAGQVYYGGFSKGQGSIHVRNPLYWWPRGLGVQNIYRLTVNLYGEQDIEDTREFQIGICKLGLNESSSGALCEVNGVRFMPMGVYYTPADDIAASESDEKITALIITAAKAGCNTIVVSGSGGFASEKLLSACDSYGITVWQELPYYSGESAMDADGYKSAITSAIKRISHHTCLMALVDSVGDERLGNLRLLCKNAAPSLSFIDKEEYRNILMASYPSIPSGKALSYITTHSSNLLCEEMEWHAGENMEKMLVDVSKEYLYASNLSDFAYLTRLTQARKITDYVRGERVNRDYGGAAIISRLSDSRPTISDSMVDYYCNPKAISAYAESFFAPILLIPKLEGGRVSFAISNEKRQRFDGFVYYRILDAQNRLVYHGSDDVSVPEMSVMAFDGRDFSEVIKGHEHEYYLEYGLREGAVAISKDTLLFVKPKRFAFVDPTIRAQISGVGRSMSLTLSADVFTKDVEISFPGIGVSLSNNYFDITSQMPVKINLFVTDDKAQSSFDLEDALHIKCVNTVGKVNKGLKKSNFSGDRQEIIDLLNLGL